MKLRNKLIATIVSISMVLAVIGVGAWASTESFTATITNTVNLEFDNIKGTITAMGAAGGNNIDSSSDPFLQEVVYDGSNVIYNQISASATSGTNLYWDGTKFLDSSDDGLALLNSSTESAVLVYGFIYSPTEDCAGMNSITAMVTETSLPEISGGRLIVKYFVSLDMAMWMEIESGVPVTAAMDNEQLIIMAVCQYYNAFGNSIETVQSSWDFNVTFSAGRETKTALTKRQNINIFNYSSGVILPYNYETAGVDQYEIIEFGEYPQTLKASNVTITSETPDANGYYSGSDGARYAKLTADVGAQSLNYKMNVAGDGTVMNDGEVYYFKVEPIKWRILQESDGQALVVSHYILKGVAYQDSYFEDGEYWYTLANGAPENTYANNYEYSSLRKYLNEDFYNAAFDATEKNKIITTLVDNSGIVKDTGKQLSVNPYACRDTQDKVFALSVEEFCDVRYGFSMSGNADPSRHFTPTDYAKASGVESITEEFIEEQIEQSASQGVSEEAAREYLESWIGKGEARTRTPCEYENYPIGSWVYELLFSNFDTCGIAGTNIGALPAMNITR